MSTYDINGLMVGDINDSFADNMHLDYCYDVASNANYTVIRVFKERIDGRKQYPFLYAPNGTGKATQSPLQMNLEKGFPLVINGTVFHDVSGDWIPDGTLIQNGVLLKQETASQTRMYMLTIDQYGDLGYARRDADGATLIQNGVISGGCGWAPIIIDYESAISVLPDAYDDQSNAQRQIIGQFGNGDYAIVTCEGRDYDHSDGWTMDEARTICQKIGLKFAFNLDGGGSTATVIGKKQINTIYEGTYGRIVPTYIVFNGGDVFSIPNK